MYGYIYKTINIVNNKIYVGQSIFKERDTYLGSGVLLQLAIKKYGRSNFQKIILEECETKSLLNEREKYWISYLNSTNKKIGYNITLGGEGGDIISLLPFKDEHYKRHSTLLKGRKKSKEHALKLAKVLSQRPVLTCPHCGKVGVSCMKQKHFDNCRSLTGKSASPHSDSSKNKIKQKAIDRVRTPEELLRVQKMGLSASSMKVKCKYCNYIGTKMTIGKYHNDKCKSLHPLQ